jgi:asparagine synthase (glutamine-hydrolysing)
MSAIAGLWWTRPGRPAQVDCARMLAAQREYGLDEPVLWSEREVALGHCGDQQAGPQGAGGGLTTAAGERFVVAADLRLDDREELFEALGISPASGRTLSDGDLLACAVERFGEQLLARILGDFAFAIWDRREQRLTLARDHLGQRPLFYHESNGCFAFASMPSGLHALDSVQRAPDMVRMTEFVGLLPMLGTESFYRDARRVQPGHVVTIDQAGTRIRRYWKPQRRILKLGRFEAYEEAFRSELDRAVKARLRGVEDRVATHLSSGWDSSSVTATAARIGAGAGVKVLAFTSVPRIGNDTGAPWGRIRNEGDIAARTAAMHANVEHIIVPGAAASPISELDRYLGLYQRPLYALSNFVWLSAIRDRAKALGAPILLTGEVGNWSISSAPQSILADLIRQRRWLAWSREAFAMARGRRARLRGIAARSFGPWLPERLWRRVQSYSSGADAAAFKVLNPHWVNHAGAERARFVADTVRRPKDLFEETVSALSFYDYGELRKGALAGWGVDERDPTADRRLIEFCLSLPLEMLLKNGERRPRC